MQPQLQVQAQMQVPQPMPMPMAMAMQPQPMPMPVRSPSWVPAPASYVPPMVQQMPQVLQGLPPQAQPHVLHGGAQPALLQAMPPQMAAPAAAVSYLPPGVQAGAPGMPGIPGAVQLAQLPAGHQVMQTLVHKPVPAPPGQMCGFQPGDRVRMKGLSQGAPYFGQIFIVETPNCGNGQARVKLEGSETVMIMSPSYLESAQGAAPVDPSAAHGQAIGHTPAWLAQDASAGLQQQPQQLQHQQQPQQPQPAMDGNGNVLQVGDLVRLRGKSQYDGQVFTVESADVGDGRVRISLQLSETSVTRMAFDPAHLELATVSSVPAQQVLSGEQYQQPATISQVVYATQPQPAPLTVGQPEFAYQAPPQLHAGMPMEAVPASAYMPQPMA